MNNKALQLKIMERLNKLASNDYDNIQKWQMAEAFNKAQLMWCRRQLHGINQLKEGDEGSKRRIDDLQILLTEKIIKTDNKGVYEETEDLPSNYFEWKRINVNATNGCCRKGHTMVVYLAEEANVSVLLKDNNTQPNYEWGETFCTLINNKVRIYTNNEFEITKATLIYYRLPRYVEFKGVRNIYSDSKDVPSSDVECEFKDDIAEVIIDEAVKILAGDIESIAQKQINEANVETNN